MNEQLQATLAKIPVMLLLVAYGGYMGWSYYSFTTDASSPLIQKTGMLQSVQKQTSDDQAKVKRAQEFYRTLEQRRAELRGLALQLEQAKASLSEEVDVSSFIRMVVAEADKVGLSVQAFKPTDAREHEYYVEQAFDLKVKGVFVQLRVFLQRLSELERIVRVGKLDVKSSSPPNSDYVLLDGEIELDTYRYRGSHADELGQAGSTPTVTSANRPGGAK